MRKRRGMIWRIKKSNGIRANRRAVEELRGDEGMCEALLEIMEPEINQMVKEATEKETKRLQEETERLQEENERLQEETERLQEETERLQEESRKETKRLQEKARKEAIETAAKILKSGKFSIEEVKEFIPRLSFEEIEAIAKGLS